MEKKNLFNAKESVVEKINVSFDAHFFHGKNIFSHVNFDIQTQNTAHVFFETSWLRVILWYYLPTPPLGQDMTQGQFLSGV